MSWVCGEFYDNGDWSEGGQVFNPIRHFADRNRDFGRSGARAPNECGAGRSKRQLRPAKSPIPLTRRGRGILGARRPMTPRDAVTRAERYAVTRCYAATRAECDAVTRAVARRYYQVAQCTDHRRRADHQPQEPPGRSACCPAAAARPRRRGDRVRHDPRTVFAAVRVTRNRCRAMSAIDAAERRRSVAEHRPVDINALVDESLNLAYHGARAEKQVFNITLEADAHRSPSRATVVDRRGAPTTPHAMCPLPSGIYKTSQFSYFHRHA